MKQNEMGDGIDGLDLLELRVSLIGNQDLKFKLVGDVEFIRLLVARFKADSEQLIKGKNYDLDDLNKQAVIINILVGFITEVNTNKFDNITENLKFFEQTIDSVILILDYFIKHIDNYGDDMDSLINNSLDILLGLSNIRNHQVELSPLLKFITSLLIITEGEKFQSILFKLLKLIPLLIISNLDLLSLMIALFSKLNNLSSIIIKSHLSSLNSIQLYQIAFDTNLPSIELNDYIISSSINLQLFVQLITASAQLLLQDLNNFTINSDKTNTTNMSSNSKLDKSYFSENLGDLSINTYISLLLLIKHNDSFMSINALNLICFYLSNRQASNQFIYNNYQKLFPRIIDLLNLNFDHNDSMLLLPSTEEIDLPLYLLSPIKIASDYCLQYPSFSNEFKRANVDLKLIHKLQINYKSNQLFKLLIDLKSRSNHGTKLTDFTGLIPLHRQDNCLLSDGLLLLSVYTSNNEAHRQRVVNINFDNNIVPQIVFELLDIYLFLLNQLHLIYKIVIKHKSNIQRISNEDLRWVGKNLAIIIHLLDNNTFTTCLYFIRSLSRSIASCRTFFVECNSFKSFIIPSGVKDSSGGFITNFLQIIKHFETVKQVLSYFYQSTTSNNNFKIQVENESIILGIISNLIRDGSSFTFNIVNYDNFFRTLSTIYNTKSSSSIIQQVQDNTIQLNVLQILKNFMAIETNENKIELFNHIPLSSIILKASYGLINESVPPEIKQLRIQQKLTAIDILRNSSAGSERLCDEIVSVYETKFVNDYQNLPSRWFEFVISNITNVKLFDEKLSECSFEDSEFMMKLLSNDNYVKMVTSLNFIENHKYTKKKIGKRQFPPNKLLNLWLKFLNFEFTEEILNDFTNNTKLIVTNNLNEIKLSIVWIIINLTMKNSSYGLIMSNETNYNLFDTIQSHPIIPMNSQRITIDDTEIEPSLVLNSVVDDLSVQDRAKILQAQGFLEVITNLIDSYHSDGNNITNEFGFVPKCFSIQNSYDLLERLKNARDQITGLLNGRQSSSTNSSGRRLSQKDPNESNHDSKSDGTPNNNTNDTTSGRDNGLNASTGGSGSTDRSNRPDVRRGGEGYGYESELDDNDYDGDELMDNIVEELEETRDIWI